MTVLRNPASGDVITEIGALGEPEVDAAIGRAAAAFETWREVAPGDRARLLRRFAAEVDRYGEELAALEVANAGHVIGNARWEAGNVRDVLEYYAAAPERHSGRQIPVPGGVNLTFHEPLGVVGIIVPWNFPMAIAGWGLAPALAAGNTVVLKPAELTPLSALRIGELALEAGLPEGVLQILPGKGSVVGQRFVTHPAVRKICFTGSTEVGRTIMAGCADQVKRVTLELGGKSANIVFADADVELAAARAPYGVFDNAGQDCCARSRILVQRSVYERVPVPAGAGRGRGRGGRPDAGGDRDGAADLRRAQRARWPPSCPRARRWRSGGRAPRARATGLRRRCWPRSTRATGRPPRRSSGRSSSSSPSRTRPTRCGWPTTRPTGSPARCGPATSAGPCGWPGPSRPGTLSVNSHSSVRYWTPFGGAKQSGIGRELGPDALDAFSDVKNVFISSE